METTDADGEPLRFGTCAAVGIRSVAAGDMLPHNLFVPPSRGLNPRYCCIDEEVQPFCLIPVWEDNWNDPRMICWLVWNGMLHQQSSIGTSSLNLSAWQFFNSTSCARKTDWIIVLDMSASVVDTRHLVIHG